MFQSNTPQQVTGIKLEALQGAMQPKDTMACDPHGICQAMELSFMINPGWF